MSNPKVVELCNAHISRSHVRLEKLRALRDEALQCGAPEATMERLDLGILKVEQSISEFMFERKQAL